MPRRSGRAKAERRERERVAQRRRGPIEVDKTWARFDRRAEHRWHRTLTERGLGAVESVERGAGVELENGNAPSPARLKNFPPRPVRPQIDRAGGNDTE